MTDKDIQKKENLKKMIADLDRKIEKLVKQKELYELSLREYEERK